MSGMLLDPAPPAGAGGAGAGGSRSRWRKWLGTPRRRVGVAAAVLVVLAAVGWAAVRPARPAAATVPTSAALESTWGVRFTQIGITADGGMVDVRYVVLDENRAAALAATAPDTPILIEESTQRTVFAVAMKAHVHDLHVGGRYYLLYRNTGGLIRPGQQVTVKVGNDVLEHMPVLGTTSR